MRRFDTVELPTEYHKHMNTTIPQASPAQRAAMSDWALRALSAPIFVVGLEWIVSGTNKIIGNFVGPFSAYVSGLHAEHIFLPGLSLAMKFPVLAARLAIGTEIALGTTLLLASFFFLRRANRAWELVATAALAVSALVATGLWLMVGRPPFWPTGNGYGSGWPVEFFLVCISLALAFAIELADPDGTLLLYAARLVRRRK
jgi:hypothetical protein